MNELKILHYNLNLTPDYKRSFDRNAKKRIPHIVDAIKEYDVCLLVETWLYRDTLINEARQYFTYSYTEPRKWYKLLNSGILILSKYPLEDIQYHHFSRNSNWDVLLSKGVIKATIKVNGILYDTYTTHCQQGNSENDHYNRLIHIQEIVEFIKSTNKNRLILVGDFNCGITKDFTRYSVHYSSEDDARKRDKQFRQLLNGLPITQVLLYSSEQDISSILVDYSLYSKVSRQRIDRRMNQLSDTTPLVITISKN